MNYELTKSTMILKDGTVLYQIRALRDIEAPQAQGMVIIPKGAWGGYIQSEHNLSQEDKCWVFYPAQVVGKFRVSGVNQIGGCVRASPEGLHGFSNEKDMLEILPVQILPKPKNEIRKTRFQILKNNI